MPGELRRNLPLDLLDLGIGMRPRQIEEHADGALQALACPLHRGNRIVEIWPGRLIADRIHLRPMFAQRRLEGRREMLRRDLREGRHGEGGFPGRKQRIGGNILH